MKECLVKHEFLQYAAQYWALHFEEAKSHDPEILQTVLELVSSKSRQDSSWLLIYWYEARPRLYFSDYPSDWTILMIESYFGHAVVVKRLLADPQVDINQKEYHGHTSLWLAAYQGYIAIVELLLAVSTIEPDVQDDFGRTPLFIAASQGYLAVVKMLLKNPEVDPDAKNNRGCTPLWQVCDLGNSALLQKFLANPRVNCN